MSKSPAEKRFRIGQRVVMTRAGRQQGLVLRGRPETACGVVVGLGQTSVVVLRDGTKQPQRYYMGFWRPERASDRG